MLGDDTTEQQRRGHHPHQHHHHRHHRSTPPSGVVVRPIDQHDGSALATPASSGSSSGGGGGGSPTSFDGGRREDRNKNPSWEKHLITWLENFHEWRNTDGDDDNDDDATADCDDDDHPDSATRLRRKKKGGTSTSTVAWLFRKLRALLFMSGGADEDKSWTATGLAWTILILVGGYSKRKQLKRLLPPSGSRSKGSSYKSATNAPLSLLYRSAREGSIEKALLSGSGGGGAGGIVYYLMNNGTWKMSRLPPQHISSSRDLLDTLASNCGDVSALPESLLSQLGTPALATLPFVYLYFVYRMLQSTMMGNGAGEIIGRTSTAKKKNTTLDDVAGLDDVLPDISEIVSYLQNPAKYHPVGAKPPRGILLYGPPGGGKTLLAQAVAGQACVDCFIACSASDFVEVYVGRGAARVRSLFSQAKQQAVRNWHRRRRFSSGQQCGGSLVPMSLQQWFSGLIGGSGDGYWDATYNSSFDGIGIPESNKPSAILFIDELDALGKVRSSHGLSSNDEREQTLNQLLIELDGFASGSGPSAAESTTASTTAGRKRRASGSYEEDMNVDESDVTLIVMAASNRVDILDPALLRRFDRQIYIGYPDEKGRRDILKIHARRVACDVIDWARLASESRTGHCSGADLRNLVNDAALLAVRDGSEVVRQSHLEHAARRLQQMKESHNRSLIGGFGGSNKKNTPLGPLGIR